MRKWTWLLIALMAVPALAVTTSHWTHTTEADFKSGSFHNVVASNLGDLKLSRAVKMLLEENPKISAVYALAEGPDHTIYAGTGPQGVLLQIKGDKVSTLATLEEGDNIFSLLVDPAGHLLIGTGGEKGRILRLDKPGDKPREIFSAEDVQYIWAMQQTADGNLYAATGPNGQLFEITPDGKHQVLLTTKEHNLLCLLSDGKDRLYVGTDPNGLVYRVDRKTKDAFVLYNAAESEITCLALDAKGNLYAATGEASDQPAGAQESANSQDKIGRPEGDADETPLPANPPATPKPSEPPQSNPGDPPPIPKATVPHLALNMPPQPSDAGDANPASPKPGEPKPGKPAPPGQKPGGNRPAPPHPGTSANPPGAEPRPQGNAIYRIDPQGFVTEIFRQPVMVLSLVEQDGVLLAGTGSDGLVYQINPSAGETLVLAKVDPKQVLCLLPASDGRIIMGMANAGGIGAMSSGFAREGTFTSPVLDASQISQFGKIHLQGSLPENTTLTVATRSGNVREPGEMGWSAWSRETPATEYLPIQAPSARFLQYRLTFTSKGGQHSPVVDEVDIAYHMPNLAPEVKSIKLTPIAQKTERPQPPDANAPPATPPSSRMQTIAWEANDPNNDPLEYTLFFRSGASGPWILLKDKLKEPQYEWDTKTVADGRYQIKVVVSDEAANPRGQGLTGSRVSDPFVVDNTPPVIGDLRWKRRIGQVRIDLKVVDRTSIVANVEYSVDSTSDWQAVASSDNMYDSPEEVVGFTVPDLAPGPHQVTIRATDSHGNQAYESLLVTVDGPKKIEKKD